jgi:hypothetical protein
MLRIYSVDTFASAFERFPDPTTALAVAGAELSPGTAVRLPDGEIGFATPNRYVGFRWDGGSYRVRSGRRMDIFHRSQLTPL